MSIFSGAPAGEKKQESDSWQNLNNLFVNSFESADKLGRKGNEAQNQASGFYKGVLAGDRTKIAPAANAATEMSDAQKREQSQMGTARGGGAAGDNQQREAHTRQLISSLLGEQQTSSADKLAAVGSGDINAMMSALGIASSTEGNLSSLLHKDVSEKNASAAKMWGSLISGGINLATAGGFGAVSGLFGGGAKSLAGGTSSEGVPWNVPA